MIFNGQKCIPIGDIVTKMKIAKFEPDEIKNLAAIIKMAPGPIEYQGRVIIDLAHPTRAELLKFRLILGDLINK